MNPITYLTDSVMIPFLQFSYQNIYPNFGLGIIILTILVKVILYPLTKQQFESMKKMQEMMPTFKKLREKHKNNPQQLQMETMKIYKEHKINPLGGCLPMLVQLPFLFALFYTMNGASFEALISQNNVFPGLTSFWLANLSQPDSLFILPIIIGLSTYLGQKMSTVDASQQKILMFMPVLMVVISFKMPAGVLLYWAISQIISSGQQIIIMKNGKEN
ncbi:MAG: YidC/Oxa1 family membrane protein insertase [Candidatus Marinamargulisbacteria bacterium]